MVFGELGCCGEIRRYIDDIWVNGIMGRCDSGIWVNGKMIRCINGIWEECGNVIVSKWEIFC
jgi:hypothetical protein